MSSYLAFNYAMRSQAKRFTMMTFKGRYLGKQNKDNNNRKCYHQTK